MHVWHMNPEQRAEYLKKLKEEEDAKRKEEEARREALQRKHEEEARQRQLYHMRLYDNSNLFLQTEGLYRYDPDGCISSQLLCRIYRNWCIREKIPIYPPRAFWLRVKESAPEYGLLYTTLTGKDGKRCRGFRGICAVTEETESTDHNI